ncbi:MAG TPA: hypothetical protein VJ836_00295 [Candidatus Saccharimonadales bacterium]|nr:hypothetical protein [Candidatus Saccharimonadales bacterium]
METPNFNAELLASAEQFREYFGAHPFVETQYVQQVLSDALIERLDAHGEVLPEGYALMTLNILADYQRGMTTEGVAVPVVVTDDLRALNYRLTMTGWARKALGDEFAHRVADYFTRAEKEI